jgi:hypothetical protein
LLQEGGSDAWANGSDADVQDEGRKQCPPRVGVCLYPGVDELYGLVLAVEAQGVGLEQFHHVLWLQRTQEGLVVPQRLGMVARNFEGALCQGRHTQLLCCVPHARAISRRQVVMYPRGAPRAQRRDVEEVCGQKDSLRRVHIAERRLARVKKAQDDSKTCG